MSIDKLDFDTTANVEGGWFINEDLDLAYFSVFASDSVPSDTSTDVNNDPWSAMNVLTSLYAPTKYPSWYAKRLEAHTMPSLKY